MAANTYTPLASFTTGTWNHCAVYLNGITQSTESYSIDPTTGLVIFNTAPGNELIITVDCTYYFRCRFVDDSYAFENFMYRLWQLKKLSFISVRP